MCQSYKFEELKNNHMHSYYYKNVSFSEYTIIYACIFITMDHLSCSIFSYNIKMLMFLFAYLLISNLLSAEVIFLLCPGINLE